ncbi:hypothetical protein [Devosia sp.]|uniref:hypothetical protein n=1 Tax=Devosia sp. TaxID=1871048 RepID=UPI002AFF0915|nr:hypothetical protein [Devosia sp.]
MSSRQQALAAIKAGDVIFGLGAGSQEKLLLVYKLDEDGFSARHVTTQMPFRFGRDGKTRRHVDGDQCTVVSTAALPAEAYEIVIGLDRKMRTGKTHPDFVLSEAEVELLLTHGDFFKSCLLAPE